MFSNKEGLNLPTKLALFLTLATLGLGAACAQAEPTVLPTFTPVPTTEPTSTPIDYCEGIPDATQVKAVSTILGSLYAQGLTPWQISYCIDAITVVDEHGTNNYLPDDLYEKSMPTGLIDQAIVCFGRKKEAVFDQCADKQVIKIP